MAQAAKVVALLSKSVIFVSTKLSIAAVLGFAVLPLLPNDAVSRLGALRPEASAPIEVIKVKAAPPPESASVEPAYELAARRRMRRQLPQANAPAHKNSAITPQPVAAETAAQPAVEAKPEVAPASEAGLRARQAAMPEAGKPNRKDEARHGKKTSSIAPPEPQKAPVPSPDAKPEAAPAEPAKPQVWSDAEIITALRECVRLLAPIAGEIEVSQPVKHQQCGAPAPVLLRRVGSGANKIEFNPPAELNCAMVVSLHAWVENTLQPAAREALGTSVARLRNVSGYVCRARNGQPLGADRLSQHALANAIDIAGFVTADGRTVDVARAWGPTERDKRETARLAAVARAKEASERKDDKQAEEAKKDAPEAKSEAKAEPEKGAPTSKKTSLIAHRSEEPAKGKAQDAKSRPRAAALDPTAKGISDVSRDPKAIPVTGGPDSADPKKSAEAKFLRRLHKGACGVFGTVLGPEANELHRDHFHLDLAPRRQSSFCQ